MRKWDIIFLPENASCSLNIYSNRSEARSALTSVIHLCCDSTAEKHDVCCKMFVLEISVAVIGGSLRLKLNTDLLSKRNVKYFPPKKFLASTVKTGLDDKLRTLNSCLFWLLLADSYFNHGQVVCVQLQGVCHPSTKASCGFSCLLHDFPYAFSILAFQRSLTEIFSVTKNSMFQPCSSV